MTDINVGDVLVIASAVIASVCVIAYQVTTRGAWTTTETGRHVMCFMGSEAVVLILSAVRIVSRVFGVTDPQWFATLRVIVFVSIPIVFLWRLRLIVTSWQDQRARDPQDTTHV
jgi:hypothetical protein